MLQQEQLGLLDALAFGDVGEEAHQAFPPHEEAAGNGDVGIENGAVLPPAGQRGRHGLLPAQHGIELGRHKVQRVLGVNVREVQLQ